MMMTTMMTKYMSHVTLISWALEMCPGVAMTVRTRRSSVGSCPPANLSSQNSNNVSFTFLTLAFLFPLLLGGGSGSAAMSSNQEGDANRKRKKKKVRPMKWQIKKRGKNKVRRAKMENLRVEEIEPGWEGLRAGTAGRREPEHRVGLFKS